MPKLKPILLVEDDSVDAMTVKRAMRDLQVDHSVIHSVNGEEAMKYLTSPDTEKPFVILLDLNMPKMNGIEFLKVIKTHPELKTIPVIVLTTSKERQDVLDTFELGASGYMVKPVDYSRFVEILSKIMIYWSSSELPKDEHLLAGINH
ncbi:MAG: response regulator [Sedimentisphaerales bacterium]|jgi:CheY-like chemotaxis protein